MGCATHMAGKSLQNPGRFFFLPLIFIILLSLPLIEIAVLVAVGSKIGVLATIGLVIATGVLGSFLLKIEGASALSRLQTEIQTGRAPDKQLANAAMVMLAGIFLIIPGFVSDVIGLLLFLPPVRAFVLKSLISRVTIIRPQSRRQEADVVDLDESEFQRTGDSDRQTSPWRLPDDRR